MAQYQITVDSQLLHQLFLGHSQDSGVAKLLESILNQVLQARVTEQLEAERYERTETGSRRQRLEQSPAVPHPVSVHRDTDVESVALRLLAESLLLQRRKHRRSQAF